MSARWLAAGSLAAAGLLLLARRPPLSRYAVEGASMEPAYSDGDRVLVNRLVYAFRRPRAGEVVVLSDPERAGRHLLKRVAATGNEDPWGVWVLGDNAEESRDSRSFGVVSTADIIGKAVFTY